MVGLFQTIIVQFYCLEYYELFWLLAVATGSFLFLHRRYRKIMWWRLGVVLALTIATALVAYITVGRQEGAYTGQYNLRPFHSYWEVKNGGNPEIYRSNFMNVVLFYPAGLLATAILPERWPGWCRCVLVTVVFGMLSVGIEYAQYVWQLGRVEIDDVIHNTAGALIGSLAALLMPPLLAWLAAKVRLMWEQYDHYRK